MLLQCFCKHPQLRTKAGNLRHNLLLKFAGLHDFNMVKISKTPFKFNNFVCETKPWHFSLFEIWFSFNLIKTSLLFIGWYLIEAKLCIPFKNCIFLWYLASVTWVGLQMINNLNIEQMATFHSCRAGKFSPHGLCYRKLLKSKCGHSILRCINYKLYWSCLLWLGTPAMLET